MPGVIIELEDYELSKRYVENAVKRMEKWLKQRITLISDRDNTTHATVREQVPSNNNI